MGGFHLENEAKEQLNDFHCNICATDLSTEQIKTERVSDIDVAYVDCPECHDRFNLMFDSKETLKVKKKIKKIKQIEHYLQTELYRELLIVEDNYYKLKYDELSDAEKDLIGGYQSNIDKQMIKEYNAAIKKNKPSFKDLLELM